MSRRRKRAEARFQPEATCVLVPLSPDELSRLGRMRRNLIRGLVLIVLTTAGMAAVLGMATHHATGSTFDFVLIGLLTLVVIAGLTEGRSQWRRIQRFGAALADRGKWVRHTRLTALRLSGSIRNLQWQLTLEGLGELGERRDACPPFEPEGFDWQPCPTPLPVEVEVTRGGQLLLAIRRRAPDAPCTFRPSHEGDDLARPGWRAS